MKPLSKSLLDPTFTYRNAANTDVRITFDRVRRERQALHERGRDAAKRITIIDEPVDSVEFDTAIQAVSH